MYIKLHNISKSVLNIMICGALMCSLASCRTNTDGETVVTNADVGRVMGAIGGAAIGSQFGRGGGAILGVAVGTLLGGALGEEIGNNMDRHDMERLRYTQHHAFEYNRSGSRSDWYNPDSGASGTVTPIRTFQHNGLYCREFRQTIRIGDKNHEGHGTACREPDGTWKIVS